MSQATAAKVFKCLSEGLRLRLVRLLREEELNGHELRTILDVPQSTLSRHLSVLKEAGLLATRRQGSWSYYRLVAPEDLNGKGEALLGLVHDLLEEGEHVERDRARLAAVLEDRRRAVRDHFERHGDTWDDFHRRVADHAVKPRMLRHLVPSGLVLVDAGCGSGYLLPELAETGARVIAVDNAPSQLAKARRRVLELGLEGIEFREGDLAHLPVEDGVADAVFAHLALHHAPRPELAVRDMARALEPGGSLVITDFVQHEEAWLRDEHADLWLGFDPEEVAGWMRAAGLVVVRGERRPFARHPRKDPPPMPGMAELELFITCGRKPPGNRKEAHP